MKNLSIRNLRINVTLIFSAFMFFVILPLPFLLKNIPQIEKILSCLIIISLIFFAFKGIKNKPLGTIISILITFIMAYFFKAIEVLIKNPKNLNFDTIGIADPIIFFILSFAVFLFVWLTTDIIKIEKDK